jgi:hypothetical protein
MMSEKVDYSESGINDPVMRCKDCGGLVHREFIHKHGRCHNCGNLRYSPVYIIKEHEMEGLKNGSLNFEIGEYVIDPDFLALFEGTGDGV